MTSTGDVALRQLALNVLAARAGSGAGAPALAAAAGSAYGDLVRVFSPLIGRMGVEALTGRAVHLANQQHSWLVPAREPDQVPDPVNEAIGQVIAGLARQDLAVAADAAATVFALLTGLLVTFIGASLTTSLLRQAWPDAFFDAATEEMKA
ncbi:MAG: hypothetical protein H0X67_10080 [Acidobacteria bacterium]|nr:hypothetical protein [Acidobacteriota bacterium]